MHLRTMTTPKVVLRAMYPAPYFVLDLIDKFSAHQLAQRREETFAVSEKLRAARDSGCETIEFEFSAETGIEGSAPVEGQPVRLYLGTRRTCRVKATFFRDKSFRAIDDKAG